VAGEGRPTHAEEVEASFEAPEAEPVGDTDVREAGTGRALASTFWTSLVVQGINTVTGVILARSLGVTDRGLLAAVLLWPRVLSIVGLLGLEESATYHVAREPSATRRVIGSGLVLWAVQSVVFVGVGAVVIPLVLGRHGSETVQSGLLFLLFIPFSILGVLLNGVLLGLQRYTWFNRVRLAIGFLLLAYQIALLALGDMGVRSMVVGYLVCYAVLAAYAAALVWRCRPGRPEVSRPMARSLLGYGVRSHASTTSSQLNQRLDLLVISIFLPASKLGLYTVAVAFTSLTGLVGASVARVALPSVASLDPGPDRTLRARRLLSLTFAVSTACAVPVILLAPWLIDLFFGSDYRPATLATRILVVGAIGFSMSRAIEAILRGVGRPLDAGIAEFVALGVTFVALAALVPALGLVGAGLASLIAYLVACGWMARRAARALGISVRLLITPDREAGEWAREQFRARRDRRRQARADRPA
jgi:O-antigen/teichoic acid export membrane protein